MEAVEALEVVVEKVKVEDFQMLKYNLFFVENHFYNQFCHIQRDTKHAPTKLPYSL